MVTDYITNDCIHKTKTLNIIPHNYAKVVVCILVYVELC